MKKIVQFIDHAEKSTLIIVFAVMVIAIFTQILNRNLFYLPLSWLEELAIYCMVYMVLLGTELGLRDGTQIRVTVLLDKLSDKAQHILEIIVKATVIAFAVMIFVASVEIIQMQIATGQTSAALGIPMLIPYAAFPISFGLIIIVQFASVIKMIQPFFKQSHQ